MKISKKIAAALLAAFMILTMLPTVSAAQTTDPSLSFEASAALYAHAVNNSSDSDAWVAWQCEHDESMNEVNASVKYFFLPSGADDYEIEIYNAYSSDNSGSSSDLLTAEVDGVQIPSGESRLVEYTPGESVTAEVCGETYTLVFMKSTAESAIYINNSNADGSGTDLISYLNADKSRSASATGAIVDSDGSIDNTSIKKIKGRGNTSWYKAKKGYNITYTDKVSVGGMSKSKKYSILANYQDDSLSRNRFLYDLSDAVGMPYASDSRYVDFYANGFYMGSYQMAQKVEAGKNNLVNDIDEDAYLDEDGNVNEDFPFLCEVDASASNDDYYVTCNNDIKLTIKCPELEPGDVGYDEVKEYVRTKYNAFASAAKSASTDLSEYADVDSLAKLYIINELGKNWDSGVSSTFFVYKQDSDGNYKFYGSPVWDYDNSLGNAAGLESDLSYMGVDDYTEYTGWWCKYKGKSKSSKSTTNIIGNLAKNTSVKEAAVRIWFEDFVPAINYFSGKMDSSSVSDELYTAEQYYELVSGSAEMNYTSGWLLDTGSWICDHSSLYTADFDMASGTYTVSETKTSYSQTFDGMYDYCVDWFTSRAAWLSSQWYDDYEPSVTMGDVDGDGEVTIIDATLTQKQVVGIKELSDSQKKAADMNGDGNITIVDVTSIKKVLVGI